MMKWAWFSLTLDVHQKKKERQEDGDALKKMTNATTTDQTPVADPELLKALETMPKQISLGLGLASRMSEDDHSKV